MSSTLSRRSLVALLALPALALAKDRDDAPRGPRPPKAIDGAGYRLVKDWDFRTAIRDGEAMRREFHTRYIYENGKLDRLKDEWQRYRDNDNHQFTPEGLALTAHVRSGLKPGGIESGMLRSRWVGQYGYYEARVKVPKGRGLWPAFWLNPEDQVWPPEIDIMEIVNNGRDTTRNSFHFVHGKGPRKTTVEHSRLDKHSAYRPGLDYADDFHTFAVEWTEDRVRHYVDDVLVVDRRYEWRHNDGRDAGPAHVLMNLAVGGNWTGAPESEAIFPARLLVDYIRVWQK